jgi:hypothetical protein
MYASWKCRCYFRTHGCDQVLHYNPGEYFGAHLDAHALPGRLTSVSLEQFSAV